jgi:hypothetical protein
MFGLERASRGLVRSIDRLEGMFARFNWYEWLEERVLRARKACPWAGTARQLNCGSRNRGSIWAEVNPELAIASSILSRLWVVYWWLCSDPYERAVFVVNQEIPTKEQCNTLRQTRMEALRFGCESTHLGL